MNDTVDSREEVIPPKLDEMDAIYALDHPATQAEECRNGCEYAREIGMEGHHCHGQCQYLSAQPAASGVCEREAFGIAMNAGGLFKYNEEQLESAFNSAAGKQMRKMFELGRASSPQPTAPAGELIALCQRIVSNMDHAGYDGSNLPAPMASGLRRLQRMMADVPIVDVVEALSSTELSLLGWLSKDDGQYGECHGTTLDGLIAKGLAVVGDESSGTDNGFIAKGTDIMFRSVSITDAGRAALARLTPTQRNDGEGA